MVTTNHYDLDIDTTLGGNNASDYIIPSQKAIKSYVDNTSGGSAPVWGNITGTLSDQTDLQSALDDKQDVLGYTPVNPSSLATVATSGDYDDLINKPTIPSEVTESTVSGWGFTKNTGTVTSVNNVSPVNGNVTLSIPAAQVNSDWNASSGVAQILNKPTLGTMAAESASDYTPTSSLATVATSGSYNDLSNKPTIPTVNNATLTITQGGTTKGTFTANASSNVTIALDAGGSNVDIDNATITENSSDQLQTVAVKDNRSGNAIKTWTGTRAQYDAITTKDANTLYNITDDTDVTLSLLELLFPVGAVYFGTMATCPLQTLGVGTWQALPQDKVIQIAGTRGSVGDTLNESLPNITGDFDAPTYAGWSQVTSGGAVYYNGSVDRQFDNGSNETGPFYIYGFDASRSSSTYQDDAPVQQDAYLLNGWRRIS